MANLIIPPDNKILPPHVLIGYVWNLLVNNDALAPILTIDGATLAAIASVTDEPKLSDSGKSYIVYGFIETESVAAPQHQGTLSLRIQGRTFAEFGHIVRVIQNAFEFEDWAAQNVNLWSSRRDEFIGIRFTSTCVTYVETSGAATEEGGEMSGILNIRYRYVSEHTSKIYKNDDTWT